MQVGNHMHSIEWWHCQWLNWTLITQITSFYTFIVAFYVVIMAEDSNLKFRGWLW